MHQSELTDYQFSGKYPWRDENVLRELYEDRRLSTYEIAALLDCTQANISKWLKRHEIPTRDSGYNDPDAPRPWLDADRLEARYVDDELSITQIADRWDCSRYVIEKWLHEHEIPTRSPVDAQILREQCNPVPYHLNHEGYPIWRHQYDNEIHILRVHRLLAVAEFGFDAVCGMDVHHKNDLSWGNWPNNLELVTPAEHARLHYEAGDVPLNNSPYADLQEL